MSDITLVYKPCFKLIFAVVIFQTGISVLIRLLLPTKPFLCTQHNHRISKVVRGGFRDVKFCHALQHFGHFFTAHSRKSTSGPVFNPKCEIPMQNFWSKISEFGSSRGWYFFRRNLQKAHPYSISLRMKNPLTLISVTFRSRVLVLGVIEEKATLRVSSHSINRRYFTSSSAISERPRCRVGQFWPKYKWKKILCTRRCRYQKTKSIDLFTW